MLQKCSFECWVFEFFIKIFYSFNKRDKEKVELAEIKMLKLMCSVTRLDRIRNEYKKM